MADDQGALYEFDRYRFDGHDLALTRGGQPVPQPPKEAHLLAVLLEHAGRVVDKRFILDQVWPGTHVVIGNLTYTIFRLRQTLGLDSRGQPFVETIPRRGYRFRVPVRRVSRDDVAARVVRVSGVPHRSAWPSRAVLAASIVSLVIAGAVVLRARTTSPPRVLRITQLTDDRRPKGAYLITDGSHLYFDEGRAEGTVFVSMPVDGRTTTAVSTPFHVIITSVSPARREFLGVRPALFTNESELFALSMAGGQLRRVGDIMTREAIFSPKADLIAYSKRGGLFVANADGGDARRVAHPRMGGEHPVVARWAAASLLRLEL
jgi:DNA-binding winged helix-turn-helix (wHTH) protein